MIKKKIAHCDVERQELLEKPDALNLVLTFFHTTRYCVYHLIESGRLTNF
ncbi:MAG: hypothetical protein AMXMBFR84_49780 [Candidatus Hydrogenedentota bacterium]